MNLSNISDNEKIFIKIVKKEQILTTNKIIIWLSGPLERHRAIVNNTFNLIIRYSLE